MGQKWSHIRNRRAEFAADAAATNVSGSSTEGPCPSLFKSLKAGDTTVLGYANSNEDPTFTGATVDTRAVSAIVFEPIPANLLNIPIEIILEIISYLPPSGVMSLSYACQQIHNRLGLSIENVLGPKAQKVKLSTFDYQQGRSKPSPSADMSNHRDRLELLCMLDRDNQIPFSKAVCSGCASTHDRSLFSEQALVLHSSERFCIGSAGCMWICPHWVFDYNSMITSGEQHECGSKGLYVVADSRPSVIWPIMRLTSTGLPSNTDVVEALRPLNAPICPHWRLNDTLVSRLYSEECTELRWRYDSQGPRPECHCLPCLSHTRRYPPPNFAGKDCSHCGTSIHFVIDQWSSREEILILFVNRVFDVFRGRTDPVWLAQINDPMDFEELGRAWHNATAICERRMRSLR